MEAIFNSPPTNQPTLAA